MFSREQLLDAVGVPADAGYERSIDSHIKSLRAKLRQVAADAEPIQTHRGLGYSYSPSHS
ncbi:Transcriptional regulatory protein CreB [compost metagenome]